MRITLDIDHAESRMFDLWNIDRKLKPMCSKIDYYVSANKQGVHVVAWIKDVTVEECFRVFFGDDLKRIDLDRQRRKIGAVTDVLWDSKGRNKVRKFGSLWRAIDYITDEPRKNKRYFHGLRAIKRLASNVD